jgi:PAP2 superfamily
MFTRTTFFRLCWILGGFWMTSCSETPVPAPDDSAPLPAEQGALSQLSAEIPLKWVNLTLRFAEGTPNNTPTYASRAFGYMGVAMYESVAPALKNRRSLVGQLSGLSTLPQPEAGQEYDWEVCLSAGQAYMLRNLYPHVYYENRHLPDSLENAILASKSQISRAVLDRSTQYGRQVADAIFQWSQEDGGFEAYKLNFDPNYALPSGDDKWVSPPGGQVATPYPLHPNWGKNRTFVPSNTTSMPLPTPLDFSTRLGSPYHMQHLAVYQKNIILTQEEKETAFWWGDDPSASFTPPGHSYSIGAIAVRTSKANLAQAVETFARVGMAVADAFVCCWRVKYKYHRQRPSGFVRKYVNDEWIPWWPEPPFPAFSSGHATQAAAQATVLTGMYGEDFAFIDTSHEKSVLDWRAIMLNVTYKNRSYKSFWAAAEDCAHSRFLGGIHTKEDNDVGLAEGKKIGQHINALKWGK